jgi:predicted ABC-class ATPase
MIRDEKMTRLVSSDKEPITPLIHNIRSLLHEKGISTILVVGGSGDYFDVADHVIMMDSYRCVDVTAKAKAIAAESTQNSNKRPKSVKEEAVFGASHCRRRVPALQKLKPDNKVKCMSKVAMSYGSVELELACVEQLVDVAQTKAIAAALQVLGQRQNSGASSMTLADTVAGFENSIGTNGLADTLTPNGFDGQHAMIRRFELAAAINRLRIDGLLHQS